MAFSLGIAVAGIGSSTSKTQGYCWYRGGAGTFSGSNYEWIGGRGSADGLIGPDPLVLTSETDPYTCDVRSGAATYTIGYTSTSAPLFLHQQTTTTLYLTTSITAAATTVAISGTGNTALAGTVVWIADEAILLGTHDTGGSYDGCTRSDFWNTESVPHLAGESVYTGNNKIVGRMVVLVKYDHSDDSETVLGRGFVRDTIGTSNDGTIINIPTVEVFSMLPGLEINQNAKNLRSQSFGLTLQRMAGDPQWKPHGQIAHWQTSQGFNKRVAYVDDAAHIQAYQAGDALVWGDYSDTAFSTGRKGTVFAAGGTQVFTGGAVVTEFKRGTVAGLRGGQRDTADAIDGPIYEVFAVLRSLDDDDGLITTAAASYSATRDLTYPFSPGEISMALLTSTRGTALDVSTTSWDCLGHRWSGQVPIAWVDTAALATLFAKMAGVKIDRLILGWDGEPVDAWDVCKNKLWRPYGLFPVVSSTGLLSLAQFSEASVEDYDNATAITAIPHTLKWDPSRSHVVDSINGTVGGWPWSDPEPFTVYARDYATAEPVESLRSSMLAKRRGESPLDFTTREDSEELVEELAVELQRLHLAMPRITFAAGPGTYELGKWYTLNSPDITLLPGGGGWFLDVNGAMISVTSGVFGFVGLLVARSHNVDSDSFELTLLLTNHRQNALPALRTPSGEISTVTSEPGANRRLNFANTEFSADDAAKFYGEEVEIYKPNGTLRSGSVASPDVQIVTAIGAGYVDIGAAFATTPVAGDILEVSYLSTASAYPEDGSGASPLSSSILAYCFMGEEADDTLGPNDLTAQIYSTKRVV